jgi:hypothetical protein
MASLFMSVPRALHFAYLIQAYEAAPQSIMARIMREHVEECDVWEPRKLKTIDFSGLSPLEIRAECAGIRRAVGALLQPLECAAVRARYGLTDYEDVDGVRRFFFDRDRSDAMKQLGTWAHETMYPQLHAAAVDVLVARHFASRRTTPITLRGVAEAFGKSHTYYGKIANELGKTLDSYEMRALDALMPYFTAECRGYSLT